MFIIVYLCSAIVMTMGPDSIFVNRMQNFDWKMKGAQIIINKWKEHNFFRVHLSVCCGVWVLEREGELRLKEK